MQCNSAKNIFYHICTVNDSEVPRMKHSCHFRPSRGSHIVILLASDDYEIALQVGSREASGAYVDVGVAAVALLMHDSKQNMYEQ